MTTTTPSNSAAHPPASSQPVALSSTTSAPSSAAARAARYRGATVLDLDPPPALSVSPTTPLGAALQRADERDYTHLTVVDAETRALRGYLSIPRLRARLTAGEVDANATVEKAMVRFRRRGTRYVLITMDTPLEELEAFLEGETPDGEKQDFAVVTDAGRRFVLGVATRWDLDEFVRRRPA